MNNKLIDFLIGLLLAYLFSKSISNNRCIIVNRNKEHFMQITQKQNNKCEKLGTGLCSIVEN
tara:strand:- start:183 stop:368 length:186 start_codon:yes stop_codon:yes gene_type:complete